MEALIVTIHTLTIPIKFYILSSSCSNENFANFKWSYILFSVLGVMQILLTLNGFMYKFNNVEMVTKCVANLRFPVKLEVWC